MVKSNNVNGVIFASISGELDDKSAPSVRAVLDGIIDKENFNKLIIDLSGLDFMDSTGIGVLLGRYKKLIKRQVPIFIAKPNQTVDKVLNLSGIYKIMPRI